MSVIRDSLKDVNGFLGDLFKRLIKKREQYLSGELVFEVNVNAFLVLNAVFLTSSLPKSMRLRPDIVRQMPEIKKILINLPKLSIFSDPGRLEKTRELSLGLYRSIVMLQLIRVKPTLLVDLGDVSTRLHTLKVVESVGSLDEVYDVTLTSTSPSITNDDTVAGDTVQRLIQRGCWGSLHAASFRGNFVAEMSPLLGSMKRVETLDLSENLIRRVQYLQGCISLTTLNLSGNSITDVSGIAQEVGNVKTLILRHNRIQSTQGLEALFGLEELDLAENAIGDITQVLRLSSLPILSSLWLEGNIIERRLAYRREVLSLFVKQFSADTGYTLCLDGRYPSEEEYKYILDSAPLLYNPVISFTSRTIVKENSAGTIGSAVSLSSSTVHKKVKSKRKTKLVGLDSSTPGQSAAAAASSSSSIALSSSSGLNMSSSPSSSQKNLQNASRRNKKKGGQSSSSSSSSKSHRKLQTYDNNNEGGGGSESGGDRPKSLRSYNDSLITPAEEEEDVDDVDDMGYSGGDSGNSSSSSSSGSYTRERRRQHRKGRSSRLTGSGDVEDSITTSAPAAMEKEAPSTMDKSKEWLNKIEQIREQTGKRWLIAVNELMKQRQEEEEEEEEEEGKGERVVDDDDDDDEEEVVEDERNDDMSGSASGMMSPKERDVAAEGENPRPVIGSFPDAEVKKELNPLSSSSSSSIEANPFMESSAKGPQQGQAKQSTETPLLDATNPFLVTPGSFKPSAEPANQGMPSPRFSLQSSTSSASSSNVTNPFLDTAPAPAPAVPRGTSKTPEMSTSPSRRMKVGSVEETNPFMDESAAAAAQKMSVGSVEETNPFLEQQNALTSSASSSSTFDPANPFLEPQPVKAHQTRSSKRASAEVTTNPFLGAQQQSQQQQQLPQSQLSYSIQQQQQQQQLSTSPSITEPLYGLSNYSGTHQRQPSYQPQSIAQSYQQPIAQSYQQQPIAQSYQQPIAQSYQQQPIAQSYQRPSSQIYYQAPIAQSYQQAPSQSPVHNISPTHAVSPAHKEDAFSDNLNSMLRDDGGLEAWLQLKVFQEDVDEFFFLALECTTHKTGFPTLLIIGTKRLYVVAAQSRDRVKDPKEWMTRKVVIHTLGLVDLRAVAVGPRYQYLRLDPAESCPVPQAALLFLTPVHEKAHTFVDALAQKVKSSYEMMDDYDPEGTQIGFEVAYLARQTRANFTSNIIKSKKNRTPPPATICVYAFVQYGEKREPMTLVVTPLRVFVCKDEFYRLPVPKNQFTKEREVTITEIASVSLDRCSLTINEDKESWVVFFPNKQELALAVSVIEQLYYAKLRIPLVKED